MTLTSHGDAPGKALQSQIVEQVKRLQRVDGDILSCEVCLVRLHVAPGERHQVEVRVTMCTGETFICRHRYGEPYYVNPNTAICLAFENVAEQLAATRMRRYRPRHRPSDAVSGW